MHRANRGWAVLVAAVLALALGLGGAAPAAAVPVASGPVGSVAVSEDPAPLDALTQRSPRSAAARHVRTRAVDRDPATGADGTAASRRELPAWSSATSVGPGPPRAPPAPR